MDNLNISKSEKQPLYVTVYNKLFKMIKDNYFGDSERLPSEPALAKSLGISRATLRQALSLLQDDGLINNIRGKGNYIVKPDKATQKSLNNICNPIYKFSKAEIDNVDLKMHIEPCNDYFSKIISNSPIAVVLIDRWYMSKNKVTAYSFTVLPIEIFSTYNIDLNDSNAILNFIENDLYNLCSDVMLEIKYSNSGNFATKDHPILSKGPFNLIEETIYDHNYKVLAYNKHYMPMESSSIKLSLKKRWR